MSGLCRNVILMCGLIMLVMFSRLVLLLLMLCSSNRCVVGWLVVGCSWYCRLELGLVVSGRVLVIVWVWKEVDVIV